MIVLIAGMITGCSDRQEMTAFSGKIMTVTGPLHPDSMGTALVHEHLLVDFIGADSVSRDRYERSEVFDKTLPFLQDLNHLGGQTLVECTPRYLGRDPVLLKQLSEASSVQILTNTGYYGARQEAYIPAHAYEESPVQISGRWLDEWRKGIGDTGIKPGFIKIGVDDGPLTEMQRKIVQAAAKTHLESGLTIAGHSGDGAAAVEELEILKTEGVHPSAFIWVHAQNESDTTLHLQAARGGAWVEFDGIGPGSVDRHVELVDMMRRNGYLHRVLISHDAGWYEVGEPAGGSFRPYDTIFTEFLPALTKTGFSENEIDTLLRINPKQAFAIQVRALK